MFVNEIVLRAMDANHIPGGSTAAETRILSDNNISRQPAAFSPSYALIESEGLEKKHSSASKWITLILMVQRKAWKKEKYVSRETHVKYE